MAKTIDQIQTLIDSQSLDARQLVNLIADYLQANPGGGGGITIYTGDGALAGDRIVEMNGSNLEFSDNNDAAFFLSPYEESMMKVLDGVGGTGGYSQMSLSIDGTDKIASLYAANVTTEEHIAEIELVANETEAEIEYTADTHTFNGKIINPELVAADFADDTAAGVGGIAVGGLYHTAGVVKVRLA